MVILSYADKSLSWIAKVPVQSQTIPVHSILIASYVLSTATGNYRHIKFEPGQLICLFKIKTSFSPSLGSALKIE